ncbi:MAG: DNA primase [Nitrosopumilus sp.]|nr:DNA primase [Nitrosopumilus sp.]
MLGADQIAKYPFVQDAGQYLKDQGFRLEQFGMDPDLEPIVKKAFDRIYTAAEGKTYKSDLIGNQASKEATLPREVFSFLLAIVLLKLSGMNTLIKRFALQESIRAEKYLEADLKISNNPSGSVILTDEQKSIRDVAAQIIKEISNVEISKPEEKNEGNYTSGKDEWLVNISDYLTRSIHFHEREWKLINRKVENGKVYLSSHQTVRLIRKELGMYINSRLTDTKTPEMIPGFENYVNKLVSLAKKFRTFTVDTGEYPPCIKHAIQVLEKGENLPHSGRFMLATFLLSKGQSVEQIAPLFKNAPDYNERVTLYQLNQLNGTSGSGTKYSCPSCEKLKTQNLCFATSECDNIINPLQFGKKRK